MNQFSAKTVKKLNTIRLTQFNLSIFLQASISFDSYWTNFYDKQIDGSFKSKLAFKYRLLFEVFMKKAIELLLKENPRLSLYSVDNFELNLLNNAHAFFQKDEFKGKMLVFICTRKT